jgi:hypothetical protein
MARLLTARLVALTLPVLASCSFLLDFDELREGGARAGAAGSGAGAAGGGGKAGGGAGKGGRGGSAGSTGAGTSGETGEGGEAGAVVCPAECIDDDPCTEDGCTSTGACRSTAITGLVLDGIDVRLPADEHFRATMTAGPDAFFVSSFYSKDGASDVTLYRLGAKDTSVTSIATIGSLGLVDGGAPLSAAGLATEPGLGLLHAFVALKDRLGTGARVWHIVLDGNFAPQLRVPVGPTYWSASPYNHPVALNLRGDVYSAWIAADQTVALGGTAAMELETLAADNPASTVTLLGTTGGDPVVLYTASGGGVYLESPSMAPTSVEECQTAPGGYLSSGATDTTIPGFWLTHWTKVAPATATEEGYLTTDGRGVGCVSTPCTLDELTCSANSGSNLIRNQALVAGTRPGDPNGLVSFVQALPYIAPDTGGTTSGLLLIATRVDFGRVPFAAEPEVAPIGDAVLVSSLPTIGPTFDGPDWPAMAFVPPNHLGLSFIEPGETEDHLRVQRYRICRAD